MSGAVGTGRHRVHPLTPILSAVRGLTLVLAVVAFNVVQQAAGIGAVIDFFFDSGPWPLIIALVVVVVAVGLTALFSWISWRHRFFEIAHDEVRIGSGWLVRSRRTARFDRVQAVDINQPLLARILGLGEVKVETAGGSDSDLTIRFLGMDDCRAVRAAVLEAKRGTVGGDHAHPGQYPAATAPNPAEGWALAPPADGSPFPVSAPSSDYGRVPASDSDSAGAPASATTLHGPVPPLRLFASAALGPGLLVLLIGPAIFVASVAVIVTLGLTDDESVGAALGAAFAAVAGTSFIGVAVFLFGAVAAVWNRWNGFHGFTLSADDAAQRLHIRAGLTSTRRQTIPVRRIHALEIIEPTWWRPASWSKVVLNVAGYAGEGAETSTVLLPVAPLTDADRIVDGVIGRITGLDRAPSEAMWASPRRAAWLSPIDWRRQTVRVTPRALVVTWGRLRRRRAIIPWQRVQGRTLRQGPLSRALGLADVRIDLVAGPVSVTAAQLCPDDAARLMRVLDDRRGA